jgi:hypothetical protein
VCIPQHNWVASKSKYQNECPRCNFCAEITLQQLRILEGSRFPLFISCPYQCIIMCLSALNIITHDGNYIDLFILKNINCCVCFLNLLFIYFIVLNATFSNISAISWRPVLVVEEAGVPGENHRPWASNR